MNSLVLAGIQLNKFLLKDYTFPFYSPCTNTYGYCNHVLMKRVFIKWSGSLGHSGKYFLKVFSHLSIYLGFGYKFSTESLSFSAPYPAMHGLEFDLQTKFCIQCHNQRNVWILCHVYIWHHSQWNKELFELMCRCKVLIFLDHIWFHNLQQKPLCQPKHICNIFINYKNFITVDLVDTLFLQLNQNVAIVRFFCIIYLEI